MLPSNLVRNGDCPGQEVSLATSFLDVILLNLPFLFSFHLFQQNLIGIGLCEFRMVPFQPFLSGVPGPLDLVELKWRVYN